MKKLFIPFLYGTTVFFAVEGLAQAEPFTKRTVISGLNDAWEVLYGPNDSLWITEDKAYRISRISLGATPVKTVLLDLSGVKDFGSTGPQPQGGLMGLAIHPNLYSSDPLVRAAKPWVYVAYVYHRISSSCPNPGPACYFNTKIERYEYRNNTLINPVTVLDNMPGSSDHNSGRLIMSPVVEPGSDASHTQYRLYYTIGDMGSGQYTNMTRTNNSQNQNVMEGKVLRLNTETDGDGGLDDWIPNDNPFFNASTISPRDYVYSMGHRNPQGLVWGTVNGVNRLYSTEQSDRADDEINLISSGSNFGWDMISGKCDGDVNGFQIGGRSITNEVGSCPGTVEPIFTTFHTNTTWSTYPSNGSSNSAWPTIAASSVTFYGINVIPGWQNSLLISPLKENRVYRLKLNANGTGISGDTISYFRGDGNRIRRVTADRTGLKFYVARDAGTIMEYTYAGITLPLRLLSFKGELQNNNVVLRWETADEKNTAYFDIERSIDGGLFSRVGTVLANSEYDGQSNYTYHDNEIMSLSASTISYRLKMVDIDEDFKYSGTVAVSLSGLTRKVTLIPNPSSSISMLNIITDKSINASWKIVDNTGRVLMQNNMRLHQGSNTSTINLHKLAAGLYFIHVKGTGIDQKIKLQKL